MYLKFSAHAYFRTRNSNLKSISNIKQLEISRNLIRDNRISTHMRNTVNSRYLELSRDQQICSRHREFDLSSIRDIEIRLYEQKVFFRERVKGAYFRSASSDRNNTLFLVL